MHPWGPLFSPNMAVTVAEAIGIADVVDEVDAVEVDTVEGVEPETTTKVSTPTAKLTAILQVDAENAKALRREETMETMSALASYAGSQSMSKLIGSPTKT